MLYVSILFGFSVYWIHYHSAYLDNMYEYKGLLPRSLHSHIKPDLSQIAVISNLKNPTLEAHSRIGAGQIIL
jgi:hypothetical protein